MNMTSLWNRSGNEMTDATTRKNRDEEKFPHQKISRFYAEAEVANTKVPWDDSQPDKQASGADDEPLTRRIFSEAATYLNYSEAEKASGKQAYEKVVNTKVPWNDSQPDNYRSQLRHEAKVEGAADGEPLTRRNNFEAEPHTRRIFSQAETHRNYSEAEDAYGKQDYEAANVEGAANGEPLTRRNHSEAEPHTRRIFSQAETHRNYSEAEDAYGKQAYEAANVEGGADVEKIVTRAAAGIGTKTENYGNTRNQRRQYSEAEAIADEVIDVTEEIEAPTEAEEEEIKKKEEAARVKKKAEETETKKTEEAARVEKKKVEECEGVLSQRRHFPFSTTSNIFN